MGSAPSQQKSGSSMTVIKSTPTKKNGGVGSPGRKSKSETRQPSLTPLSSNCQLDVMISYSHADTSAMTELRESLIKQGFIVWVDVVGLQAGVNFFDKIGKAIINARMFIALLSEASIKSKYCQDEISLGYVLNKPIFPVNIQEKESLVELMDVGMRLEFANLTWYDYTPDTSTDNVEKLFAAVQKAKDDCIEEENCKKMARNPAKPLKRALTRSTLRTSDISSEAKADDWWEKNFPGMNSVTPQAFMEKFVPAMSLKLKSFVKTESDKRWIQGIIRRKLVRRGMSSIPLISKSTYDDFCQDEMGGKMPFFSRIEEYTVERYAIRQVFEVDSSVRLQAIENLGKYHSMAIIDALTELLDDTDADARAVAAITLAKTGIKNKAIIPRLLKLLKDEDRLVRESACLSLGHLQVEQAVPDLVFIWRTEVMSSVRDAAEMALKKVGGKESEQALHMVGVLQKEIQFLIAN